MKRESYYFQTVATDRLSELLSSGACVKFYTDMCMGSKIYVIEWRR
ncbi:hypothetical protein PHB09_155 [Pseudomonas phage PHB09]|uniref:Uncharacterized protein n=1 Tax=Pseudomonas phage PHB09 TaxID=2867265 RepID=A0AAE8XCF8_9CAUD|nr:hypothetical protein QGX10_gp154 [Pseudomonas phage PHB09]UAV84650.1 hypothetical protein PHB09_155 [Pseudomonas phage PHB09]